MFFPDSKLALLIWTSALLSGTLVHGLLIFAGWNIALAAIFPSLPDITYLQAIGLKLLLGVVTGSYGANLSFKP